ncbi:hypothetical protein Tco_0995832 [Tanacetum coccineum]
MSLIHAFSIEDMYSHEFSNSFQHTSFFQEIARKDSPVKVAAPPPKSKSKPTRGHQKRTIQNEDAPWQIAWTNEEGIALCKSWVHVSESSKLGNTRKDVGFRTKVIEYMESKIKQYGRRMYDMVNGKWKTVCPHVVRFCGVYNNVMRRAHESGAGDEDYYNMTLLHYKAQTGVPFKLRHCWRDKAKGSTKEKGPRSLGSSSTNDEALARLMVSELAMQNKRAIEMQKEEHKAFLEIKRKEVECREREFGEDLSYTLDFHPHLPDPGFTMDRFPAGAIGIYSEFLQFSGVYHRAIPDYLAWRHSCSCVSDDLPTDGYDRNDVEIDDNAEMSIYDFMTLPSWSEAKIVEESHHLSLPLLERVPSHTIALATEGAIIPLPTPDEIGVSLPDSRLVKKSKELDQAEGADEADLSDLYAEIEDRLERDEAPASTSSHSLSLGGAVASGRVGKSGAEVMRRQMDPLDCLARSALARDAEYDQISDDDFGTATRGEEIDLTLFPFAPGLYHMPYPYEGVSSSLYTKEEKALDRTITLAELRRTKSLLPLELSNRVNVLSALLVSHGYELNSRYTNLVSYKALLQEKLNQKKGDVRRIELCSQRDAASEDVKRLQSQLTDAKAASTVLTEELTRIDAKLSEQALTVRDLQNELTLEKSKSQGYKDAMDGLREEVARKLLSSDEFHTALARVASLGVNYGVERGLRMRRTDVEFEVAVQKVFNFHAGGKADFDKALVDFPTTPFSFLSKIVAASGGTLSDVAQILSDKFIRSATSVSVAPFSVNEAPEQVSP